MQVDPSGNHIGMLYQKSTGEVSLCHLANHHDLKFNAPRNIYKWVNLDSLAVMNKETIAAFIQALEDEHPDIPYGFNVDGVCFDQDGKYIPQPLGTGFTCATWVTALFAHIGFELADISSWPDRPEDTEWQEHVAELIGGVASQEHLDALANDVGAKRVRPEEVVACGLQVGWPSTFNEIEEMAAEIIEELAA